jgi:hypothetical protein
MFVKALKKGLKVSVTKEIAGPLALLAKEFFFPELLAECLAQTEPSPDIIATLSDRISRLEHRLCSSSADPDSTRLRIEIADLKRSVDRLQSELEMMKAKIENQNDTLIAHLRTATRKVSVLGEECERKITDSLSPVTDRLSVCEKRLDQMKTTFPSITSPKQIGFALHGLGCLDGIISYLTRKHGGNVHTKGIVTVTSKSVGLAGVENLVDLTSDLGFFSQPFVADQWVCLDFHRMRVRRMQYTIRADLMKSWMLRVPSTVSIGPCLVATETTSHALSHRTFPRRLSVVSSS